MNKPIINPGTICITVFSVLCIFQVFVSMQNKKSIDIDEINILMDEKHSTHVDLSDTLSIDFMYPTIDTTLKSMKFTIIIGY